MIKKLSTALMGGILGGATVGLLEALYLLSSAGSVSDYVALFYAVVLYGAIGLGMGVGVALGVAGLSLVWKKMSDAQAWTLGFFGVFAPLGMVITRFIANKVVYGEQGVPMSGNLTILAIFGGVFLLDMWLLPILLNKTPLKALTTPKGFAGGYGALLLITGVFSLAPAGAPETPQRPGRDQSQLDQAPNVLLIMVDTLRADYTEPYDDQWAGKHPTLMSLAGDGVVFEEAHANASWTRSSFANIYTSSVPSTNNTALKSSRLPSDVNTLAEVLQERGYATGGLPNNTNVTATFGFGQGFDYYPYQAPELPFFATESVYQLSMYSVLRKVGEKAKGESKEVTDFYQPADVVLGNAQGFIEAQDGDRWFLMVHLMEPHDPYFERPYNGVAYGRAEHEVPEADKVDYLKQTYATEIEYMDKDLAVFIQWLRDSGQYDDTVILVSADHGEEFLEHGGWWHGTTLYEEQIHVPMVLKLPDNDNAGTRVPWVVRHVDIAPTLATLAGAELPGAWQGTTMLDADFETFIAPPPEPQFDEEGNQIAVLNEVVDPRSYDRVVLAEEDFEGNQISAVMFKGWKYLEANEGNPRGLGTHELYDMALDAGEQRNVYEGEQAQATGMKAVLGAELAKAKGDAFAAEETEIDAATQAQLEALGYMGDE